MVVAHVEPGQHPGQTKCGEFFFGHAPSAPGCFFQNVCTNDVALIYKLGRPVLRMPEGDLQKNPGPVRFHYREKRWRKIFTKLYFVFKGRLQHFIIFKLILRNDFKLFLFSFHGVQEIVELQDPGSIPFPFFVTECAEVFFCPIANGILQLLLLLEQQFLVTIMAQCNQEQQGVRTYNNEQVARRVPCLCLCHTFQIPLLVVLVIGSLHPFANFAQVLEITDVNVPNMQK